MNKELLNIFFTAFLVFVFAYAAVDALTFSRLAQFFPLYISSAGALLTSIYLVFTIIQYKKSKGYTPFSFRKPLRYIAWFLGFLLTIYVFGLMISTILFLSLFLIIESKMSAIKSMISVGVTIGALLAASHLLGIYWPTNLLGI